MSSKSKRRKLDIQQDQENHLVDNDNEFRLLPELLNIILTKAVFVQMYSKDTAKRESDKSIFSNLASVEFLWWSSMKNCNLRNKIRRLSKVYFQRLKLRSTIIRNNRNFLKEVINPDEIIFRLESCGCFTEDQVTFLMRLRNYKDKNHELLFMLQDFSSQKYIKLLDCLFVINQSSAALVLERGGASVKVHVSNGNEMWTREFEMELIERFQRMHAENKLILNDLINVFDEKELNDVHVLHAKQNKGVELWFWCKTGTSLKKLKSLSDQFLREIIHRMYKRLIPEHSTYLEPELIQRDSTLASDFAERRLSVPRVKNRYSLNVSGYPRCVASLGDKIYIARFQEILVFQNKYPFQSLKSIELSELVSAFLIASCSINKCFYILAYDNLGSCIHKVEPEIDNRMSKWRHDSAHISVSSRGDVLVLQIKRTGNMVCMITPEGTVKRTIPVKYHFGYEQSIQEMMPDIVALCYRPEEWTVSCITIMRLDENGTILRYIEWNQEIVCLSSCRYGDLLIGVSGYKNDAPPNSIIQIFNTDLVDLEWENDEDSFSSDEMKYFIHFVADQKQLYVLHRKRLRHISALLRG